MEYEEHDINTIGINQLPEDLSTPPEVLYIFPLIKRPFFPGMAAPLVIESGAFLDAFKEVSATEHRSIGLFLTKSENVDPYKVSIDDLHPVGVLAKVLRIIPLENGRVQAVLSMEKRISIVEGYPAENQLKAKVVTHEEIPLLDDELKAYGISIMLAIKELLKMNPLFKEELQIFLGHTDFTDPCKLADFAVALTTASREELQDVLEAFEIHKRIDKALTILKKELDLSSLQSDINQKIDAAISKGQRDFFLREQLKTIKKELGIEKEDKSVNREKFEARIKDLILPADVAKVINDEMDKLSILETQSGEYAICRNYLDWLTSIPWGVHSPENYQISTARKILDEDHYGLDDIKQRIIELMSVSKLAGKVKGSIICLVGPPGVGKTSIGKSIARALNRKFYRFSVGGMRDEAEVKGHRRTYLGAMPGKLIQALKYCQTMNPVIMLDEIDKMSNHFHGDPASALLEVLDPEQNCDFLDHYLDVGCDLSNVLFITTANVLDSIPGPLKDRMEILRLSGYIMQEKIEIGKTYLIPRHRKAMGLKASQVVFNQSALRAIINEYAREAGVRSFENEIKKILRKVTLKIVEAQEIAENKEDKENKEKANNKKIGSKKSSKKEVEVPPKVTLTSDNLVDYLGKPRFTTDRFHEKTPVGVCTGLAWTSMGGATLYVETIKVVGEKRAMMLTGQVGHVMRESADIAWSFLHSAIHKYAQGYTFFDNSQVHVHFPEGATPKDGPSAGITMVTALLSLLLDTPVLADLGMTGELTLTGRVLAIGGIKEKIVAAKRSGLKILIFPKDCARDLDELPVYIKKGLTFHFVQHYDDVFRIAFPHLNVTK
ncbi:MAG: endopeptidase La [Parachlamydiaceae bacterium]|nr:endopeptidase La [Parachlamydiaceae bacterium]